MSGDYEILGALGRGGVGTVFRARERGSGREVALKILLSEDAKALERFEREGQVTASLRHPGIVAIHGAGRLEGRPYLAYELVEGESLAKYLLDTPREQLVAWVRDVARALGFAHARGLVHRDVKPANILVDGSGRVRVADFGLVAGQDLERLTRTGALVGTMNYMAPEQVGGERDRIGPPSDVWALGVVLYEVLARQSPFSGGTPVELFAQIARARPPALRSLDPSIPAPLAAVCRNALRADPDERYPNGDAMADDLERALRGERVVASGGRTRLGLLVVGGVGLAVWVAVAVSGVGDAPASNKAPQLLKTPPAKTIGGSTPPGEKLRSRPKREDLLAPPPRLRGHLGERGNTPLSDQAIMGLVSKADESTSNPQTMARVGTSLLLSGRRAEERAKGLRYLKRAALAGVEAAMIQLGLVELVLGYGEPARRQQGLRWLRKAAKQGATKARYYLGECYRIGLGVKRDTAAAAKWFVPLAYEDEPRAVLALGVMQRDGELGPRDPKGALSILEGGLSNPLFTVELGRTLVQLGRHEEARRRLRQATATADGPKGQLVVADLAWEGLGVARDREQAKRTYSLRALGGDPRAMTRWGRSLLLKDPKLAKAWLRRAALDGDFDAHRILLGLGK